MPAFARFALALAASTTVVPGTPAPGSGVNDFLGRCSILGSLTQGNLTVVAVRAGTPEGTPRLLTLDEALAGGQVTVRETEGGGTVNTLVVRNHGTSPVFVMAGEILAGAKQDRILQQDVLLPGGGQSVQVPAFCVEHGRWQPQSAAFFSEKVAAPVSVRRAAQAAKSQAAVWEEVAQNNAEVSAIASTGSLSATYKAGKVVASRQGYLDALARLPRRFPGAAGVVVVVNGRVAGADLFRDPALFGRLWAKLLDSYIAEAVRRDGRERPGHALDPETFLRKARLAQANLGATPGIGRQVALEGEGVKGAGVLLETPVHLDLFPTEPGSSERPLQHLRERPRDLNVAPRGFRP